MKYFIILLIFLSSTCAIAQVDDLFEKINNSNIADSTKAKLLLKIAYNQLSENPDSTINLVEKANAFIDTVSNINLHNDALYLLKQSYFNIGKLLHDGQYFKEALESFNRSEKFYFQSRLLDNVFLAELYFQKGYNYISLQNDSLSILYLIKSQNIYIGLNDKYSEAYCLRLLGVIYADKKEYRTSASYLEAASNYFEFGHDTAEYKNTLFYLGFTYQNSEDYIKSIGCYNKVLELSKKTRDTEFTAAIHYHLGIIYRNTSKYKESVEHLKNAKNEFNLLKDTSSIADVYKLIGDVQMMEKTNLNEANRNYIQSENYYNLINDKEGLGKLYNSLGMLNDEMSNYSEAIKYFEKSITLSNLSADSSNLYATINNMAVTYRSIGASELSLRNYKIALNYYTREGFKTGIAACYSNIGSVMNEQGEYSTALEYFNKSLELNKLLGDKSEYSKNLGQIGNLYEDFGNYNEANKYYFKAVEEYKKINKKSGIAHTLNSIAGVYKDNGDYKNALNFYQNAYKLNKEINAVDEMLANKINIGVLYSSQNKFKQALKEYKEIEDEVLQINNSFLIGSWYSNIGVLKGRMGDHLSGIKYLRLAQKTYEKTNNESDLRKSLFFLSKNYFALGFYDSSFISAKYANSIDQDFIKNNFNTLNEEKKELFINEMMDCNNFIPNLLLSDYNLNDSVSEFILESRIMYKGILLNGSIALQKSRTKDLDPVSESLFQLWRIKKLSYNKIAQEKSDTNKLAIISILKNELDSIELNLTNSNSKILDQIIFKDIKTKDIQNALSVDEAAIEFIRFNKYSKSPINDREFIYDNLDSSIYAGIIVAKKGILKTIIIKNGHELENVAFNYYREHTSKPNSSVDSISYSKYWKVFDQELKQYKKIYISADGIYNKINLSAIYNTQTNKFVVEEKDIVLLSSLKEITNQPNNFLSENNTTAVLFGDPIFKLETQMNHPKQMLLSDTLNIRMGMHQLPATKIEVEKISEEMKLRGLKPVLYIGKDANETNLKFVNSPTILHIATHGFFLKDDDLERNSLINSKTLKNQPLLRSGLLFSGARNTYEGDKLDGEENGILYALEASELDLSTTQLVVLSACETANGENKNGEGVYGLQRAFKKSGARQIIMSMWSVPDNATRELMIEFYKNYLKTQDAQSSLKTAQLKLKSKYPNKPFYWGAFVIMGK